MTTIEKPTIYDVANYGNLLVAAANARQHKGKYQAVKRFENRKEELLRELETAILSGNYRTSPYVNKTIIDSGKERLISKLPYFPDRIAQWSLMMALEPQFMDMFSKRTHAAIRNRGIHSALNQVRAFVLHHPEYRYCLKLDIRKYFQHVDHDILKQKILVLSEDEELLEHIRENIDSFPEGIPIGNYTSQYWANYYLISFDSWLESTGYMHVRYMDDIVVFGRSPGELHDMYYRIKDHLKQKLNLDVKDNWQVFPIKDRGIDFAGYRVFPNRILVRKSIFRKLRRKLAKVEQNLQGGEITEHDMSVIGSYAGWVKYCTPKARKTIYEHYFRRILDKIEGHEKYVSKIQKMVK